MLCPCCKYEPGLKKNRHARGKVDNILLSYMQKSREALADPRKVFERESKTNNEHTVAALCQKFYSLVPFF